MFILLKSIARSFILPPIGLIVLAILGLVLSRWYRRLGMTLLGVALAAFWLCATPFVADRLEWLTERYPALDLSGPEPVSAQAVVILAGGAVRRAPEYAGPAAASQTLERLNYGAYVAKRKALPVLVSGSPAEAEAMDATLRRNFDIRPRWVENRSGDTFENAEFSARLLVPDGIHRIILITSGPHEWRAVHEFMSAGFEVVPAPVGNLPPQELKLTKFVPNDDALTQSHSAFYELIGDPVRQVFAALHLRRHHPQS